MKIVNSLNKNWEFYDLPYNQQGQKRKCAKINLPHTVKEEPINYFDEKSYQFISHYKKHIEINDLSERYFIRFEGVMNYCKLYCNGQYIGEHKGGFTAFKFEISEYIKIGDNEIIVEVDSTERNDIPPYGFTVDYVTYGGIYRDVDLLIADKVCITNVKADSSDCIGENAKLAVHVEIDSKLNEVGKCKLILCDGKTEVAKCKNIPVELGKNVLLINLENLKNIELWDIETPKLYNLRVEYKSESSESYFETRIGFRKPLFTKDGFYLNGKKIKIFGLNRHQDFPVIGYAAPERLQKRDADILKNELSLNFVRTSHYPQSKYFLDRCDELGLLVFEEIPGWQHIGDKQWQEVAKQNVKEMINHDYNHPSIVLWGVRINESEDCDPFYKATNEIAHALDKSRQTAGVRCCKNSNLLEDVYTFNDFSFDGTNTPHQPQQSVTGLSEDVPYMVTEFCGHTHPTKSFDQEERAIEYAMRFTKIMNSVMGDKHICGAIGWCAFDYHTHFTFGSGDRICYHGVMDMFRIPKFAAYFFKSQKSPAQKAVLEPATRWTVGDRNLGGINPLLIYTNCDYVTLEIQNKDFGKFYPDKEDFPNLKYPPILIKDINVIWGGALGDALFKGFVNDECVITREFTSQPVPSKLLLKPDDDTLTSDNTDMTRVVIKALDQKDNILPFFFAPVNLTAEGEIDIVGNPIISTIGGVYAVWIKSKGVKGKGRLIANSFEMPEASCEINIK